MCACVYLCVRVSQTHRTWSPTRDNRHDTLLEILKDKLKMTCIKAKQVTPSHANFVNTCSDVLQYNKTNHYLSTNQPHFWSIIYSQTLSQHCTSIIFFPSFFGGGLWGRFVLHISIEILHQLHFWTFITFHFARTQPLKLHQSNREKEWIDSVHTYFAVHSNP